MNSNPQTQLKSGNKYKLDGLMDDLYTHHVNIDSLTIQYHKRAYYASTMKEVCHHHSITSCEAYIKRKLSCDPIDATAINYGRDNEYTVLQTWIIRKSMESLSKWHVC